MPLSLEINELHKKDDNPLDLNISMQELDLESGECWFAIHFDHMRSFSTFGF